MVFKRKATFKRRAPAPKRRRTMNISRPRVPRIGGQTLVVKRMVHAGVLFPGADLATGTPNFWQYNSVSLASSLKQFNATSSRLTGLTNVAEYSALFDQYKLGAYKVTLRPRQQEFNTSQNTAVSAANNTLYPPMFAIGMDSKNTILPTGTYSPPTLNVLLESGARIKRADREVNIYVKPMVQEQYGNGAIRWVKPAFTNMDTAGLNMEHSGFHLFLYRNGFATDQLNLAWDVTITYYLTFKNSK